AVPAIARGELAKHIHVGLKKPIQDDTKFCVTGPQESLKVTGANDDGSPRNLTIALVSGRLGSQQQRDR
ncbi:MAG: hypothetical protein WAK11_08620, partial [Candidatus Cybelea sp.]